MTDEKGQDEKILTVPCNSSINDITSLDLNVLNKIKEFFIHYKDNTVGRWSQVGEFRNAEHAQQVYATYQCKKKNI